MAPTEMLTAVKMSSRPAFYSGRGATTSDLDGRKLHEIHSLIKKHHGEEAAKGFVAMVESMSNMNATDFIENLFCLARQQYAWNMEPIEGGMAVDKDKNGEYNLASGLFGIGAAMGPQRDETHLIRNGFLATHGSTKENGS